MNKQKIIGILTPNIDGQYFGALVYHIHRLAESNNMRVIIVCTLGKTDFSIPLAVQHVDGWIVIKNPMTDQLREHNQSQGKPIVGIGHKSSYYPTVQLNNRKALEDSVTHLVEHHGHRRIAFIADLTNTNMLERLEGYKDALIRNAIDVDPRLIIETNDSYITDGMMAADKLSSMSSLCTAVIACSDNLAIHMISKLKTLGLQVPQQLAVIGFDDAIRARGQNPSLTTMHLPTEDMAQKAIELLLARPGSNMSSNQETFVDIPIVIRESCGCLEHISADIETIQLNNILVYDGYEHTIEVNRQLSDLLAKSDARKIHSLDWMTSIRPPWACFAKWDGNGPKTMDRLKVTSTISEFELKSSIHNLQFSPDCFPALETIPEQIFDNNKMAIALFPIQSPNRDWGVLALAQSIDQNMLFFKSSTLTYSYVLLGTALERLELFEQNHRMTHTLETVSNMTNDGIWELDLETRQIEWSQRIQGILGFIPETVPARFIERIHESDKAQAAELFQTHYLMDKTLQKEIRVLRADQQYIWIEMSAKAIPQSDGLPSRIIGSLRDITERKKYEQQINYMAYHDTLTGLPNRALFLIRLNSVIEHARMNDESFAVLLLDLDRFKYINDRYGHHTGDTVLKHVSNQLTKVLRMDGIASRHGGDEFIVLLPGIKSAEEVYKSCERILELFEYPVQLTDGELFITCSVGFSIFPQDGYELDTLINNADVAMYQAKSEGRNRFKPYTPELDALVRGRLQLSNEIRQAMAQQQFELFYQPQIHNLSGRIIGMEALMRWHSPERGYIPPMDFIPLAEETGLIVPLGEWALREACLQNKIWQDKGFGSYVMSVNVSGLQLISADFLEHIHSVLQETNMQPNHLCLEITENIDIDNRVQSIINLQKLMDMGVQIALDDFGTGYSSLSVLNVLPLHVLKIDKSFIQQLERNGNKSAIVRSILAMSQELGLQTIAEGVEEEFQLDLLRQYGCDIYQGYYFSKPCRAKDLEPLLLALSNNPM